MDSLQRVGTEVVNVLFSLSRALRLYDPNNAAVQRIIDDFCQALDQGFAEGEPELQLRLLQDEAFINGRLLRADLALYERITSLHRRLAPTGVNELTFRRGAQRADIESLTAALAEALRVADRRLEWPANDHVALGWTEGDAIASFRFDPDRLAVWLYRSLLDMVDTLYEQVGAGARPSLLPLRRTLQLVIDSMRSHSGVFQVLAALRDPAEPVGPATRRVMVAVDLVGLALWLGLPLADVLTLGLAGLLGGFARGREPDAAVRTLLRFEGLGETALPLTLLLHDAVSVRAGGAGAMPGRCLALVEEYVAACLFAEGHEARAPRGVLDSLVKGGLPWADKRLVAAFARYKGPFPLGSLVTIDPGGLAVVVAAVGEEGRRRPTVVPIGPDGRAREPVDLAAEPDRRIVGVPKPSEARFSPALLLSREA
ncbi:MAG: hypothetical protein D6798_17780 [Deltaproteobacteria bacterium]|nr:MAG: hypothetical protein D6798_17780 [Deltaproteobacteria bacterium]